MSDSNSSAVNKPTITNIDRLIHEPARYNIMAYLYVVESADFIFLQKQIGLTWGNLGAHAAKLEAAGYVEIQKEFLNRKPHTLASLTDQGRLAFEAYRKEMTQMLNELPHSNGR